jgi:hypothetical protein
VTHAEAIAAVRRGAANESLIFGSFNTAGVFCVDAASWSQLDDKYPHDARSTRAMVSEIRLLDSRQVRRKRHTVPQMSRNEIIALLFTIAALSLAAVAFLIGTKP